MYQVSLESFELPNSFFYKLKESSSGLTHWYFETERYFGPECLEVKDKRKITVLPLEPSATEPFQKLKYDDF